MDTSIIIAAFGVIATLLAPVIGVAAVRWSKSKDGETIPKARQKALDGVWEGSGIQQIASENSPPTEFLVHAKFAVTKKKVLGEIRYHIESDNKPMSLEMNCSGGLLHGNYVKLDYTGKADSFLQYGTLILQLSELGKGLSGKFVEYRSMPGELVN